MNYQTQGPGKPKGMAITAMVLGICAFVPGCCIPYLNWVIAPICALLAIIFGTVALKAVARGEADGGGMAKTGLILGIINLALIVIGIILVVIVGVSVWNSDGFQQALEEAEAASQNDGEFQFDFESAE